MASSGQTLIESEATFSVQAENGKKVLIYGLGAIRNISFTAVTALCEERNENGPYKNIFDFVARANSKCMNKRQLEYLIKAGAFDSLCRNRKQLFESIELIINYYTLYNHEDDPRQLVLFPKSDLISTPVLISTEDWDNRTKLNYECDAFGFFLLHHPLDIYKTYFDNIHIHGAAYVHKLSYGTFRIKLAAIPIAVYTKVSAKGRYMTCIVSTQTGMLKVFIFDEEVLKNGRELIYSKTPVIIDADIIKDDTSDQIIVRNLISLDSYLSNHKPVITITICDNKADIIKQIKTMLQQADQPGLHAKIILNVVQDGHKIKIELPSDTTCDLLKLAADDELKDAITISTVY